MLLKLVLEKTTSTEIRTMSIETTVKGRHQEWRRWHQECIKNDVNGIKKDVDGIKKYVDGIKKHVGGIKKDVDNIKQYRSVLKKKAGKTFVYGTGEVGDYHGLNLCARVDSKFDRFGRGNFTHWDFAVWEVDGFYTSHNEIIARKSRKLAVVAMKEVKPLTCCLSQHEHANLISGAENKFKKKAMDCRKLLAE